MRITRPKMPKTYRLELALQALRNAIPVDFALRTSWPESMNGAPNLRVQGTTNDTEWVADLYHGNFFRVQIGNSPSQILHSVPGMAGFIRMRLNLSND